VGPWPAIGSVDTLVLPGPHGSLAVRRHIPTEATSQPSGALIYIHGGGFTYGTLDEFEVPMRLIAEQAGIRTYVVEYQLAPEAKYPPSSTRSSTWSAGFSIMPLTRVSIPRKSRSAGIPRAGT